MKKRNQLLALCALVILVLTVFACENPFIPGKYKEPSPPQAPTVSVDVTPIGPYVKGEGLTITAKASVGDGGDLSYQWYSNTKNSNSGGTKISGAAGESYRPSTNIEDSSILIDSTYYYVQVTNTLYGRTTPAASRTVDITAYDTEGRTAIREVSVDVNIPLEGDIPSQTAFVDGSGYACTGIAWAPQHNPFRGNIKYTARITLEALSEHTLIALRSAAVNGQAVKFKYDPYASGKDEVELEYTFSEVKTVMEIAIVTQPTNRNYTHGDEINLSGLVVRMTYNTGETEDVALSSFASRNITTNPAHNSQLSHTNHDGKPVVISFAGLTAETANLTVSKAVIATPDVTVIGPATTAAPDLNATVDSAENYTSSQVTWIAGGVTFTGSQFAGNTQYTARVTLTVKSGDFVFAQGNALTAKINGFNAVVSNNSQTAITISHTFNSTTTAAIASIAIKTQPTNRNYTHGDPLNLAGLVVTLNYEGGGTPDDVAFANFEEYNISTVPIQGAVLRRNAMIDDPVVVVSCGVRTARTGDLTIAKKTLTVTGASHTKQYDGQLTANSAGFSNVTFAGRITVNGVIETVTCDSVTGTYINKNAGTVGMTITSVELAAGESNTNYTVTTPSANFNATGGITKRTITIIGATHTKPYDGTRTATGVSNVVFNNYVEPVTYDTVTAQYIGSNAGTTNINISNIILTGDSNTNYTVTLPASNVPVSGGGITKLTPTVTTWPTASNVNSGDALSTSTLNASGAQASVDGTYTWRYPDTIMNNVGPNNQQDVVFTPTSGNYEQVFGAGVFVTVNPKVTFVLNGGTLGGSTNDYIIHGTYNGTVTKPTDPTRSNYTFAGWHSDSTLTTPYYFGATVTSDFTLYAKWILTSNINSVTGKTNGVITTAGSATGMAMVFVDGGTYSMGKDGQLNIDQTPHDVTLSSFYMGKYEVTQEQYQSVIGSNPSYFTSAVSGESDTPAKLPVENLTWFDAIEFCNRLSEMHGLDKVYNLSIWQPSNGGHPITDAAVTADWSKNGYRLPTEAEWEYVAKNIRVGPLWSSYNSGSKTHKVGSTDGSVISGVYNLYGNVAEFCTDSNYNYTANAQINPVNQTSGSNKIIRGGNYSDDSSLPINGWIYISATYRFQVQPAASRSQKTGFRVARNAQ